ncbi:hypothetical protein Tco_0814927 [Tanacetum coccineum]
MDITRQSSLGNIRGNVDPDFKEKVQKYDLTFLAFCSHCVLPNGEGLRKSILSSPYVPSTRTKEHFISEQKEAISFAFQLVLEKDSIPLLMLLKTANEMWIALKGYTGESFDRTRCKDPIRSGCNFGKFTSRDGDINGVVLLTVFIKLMNELSRTLASYLPMQENVQFYQTLSTRMVKDLWTVVKQSKELRHHLTFQHTFCHYGSCFKMKSKVIRAEKNSQKCNTSIRLIACHLQSQRQKRSPNQVTPQSESVSEGSQCSYTKRQMRGISQSVLKDTRIQGMKIDVLNKVNKVFHCKLSKLIAYSGHEYEELVEQELGSTLQFMARFRRFTPGKNFTLQNLPQNRKQAEIHSNVLKSGMHRIATSTKQNREPQLPHASRNSNPHVSKSTGVTHPTSVSRPQLKSYQVKDKVVPNISQVKFTKKEVEDHKICNCVH